MDQGDACGLSSSTMDSGGERGKQGGFSPSCRVVAVVVLLIFFFGGGWASLASSGGLDPGEERGAIERASLELRLAATLPDARDILGMLALDRDVVDYEEYAELKNAGGEYYRKQARIAREMRPLRARYEATFAAAYARVCADVRAVPPGGKGSTGDVGAELRLGGREGKPPYVAKPDEVWLPPRSDLPYAHPYALDCFFVHVDKHGGAERGPAIRAIYPGLVVAAAEDWSGGAGIASWKGGGMSPAAGNGVVVYDPAARRYVSCFHLASVSVRKGEIVEAGEALGRGGNTGMNARKSGHGGHVHLEIFDCKRDAALPSGEILDLLSR